MKNDKKDSYDDLKEVLKFLPLVTQIGLTIVGALGISLIIGYYLDKYLNTRPLFLIIFLFVGLISGFYNVYVSVNKLLDKKIDKDEK